LETRLGCTLLERRRSGCRATPKGERFAPLARSALTVACRAISAVVSDDLMVGASSNPGLYLLPAYLEDATGLRLGSNAETLDQLVSGLVDLAVTEWQDGRPGVESYLWRQEEMVGIVPPGHRWAGLGRLALRDYLAEPLIGGEPGTGTGRLLAEALGTQALPLRIARQMSSTEGVKRAVAAGLGISIVLACAVRDEVAAGSVMPLVFEEGPLLRPIYASLRSGTPQDNSARRFLARLQDDAATVGLHAC
jgi:DNA-binding transcriptional LysR family regulator